MAITLVASVSAALGPSGGTSGAIDTTGANLLVVSLATYALGGTPTITDSKSNAPYSQLTARVLGDIRVVVYYRLTPTVGPSHTFTVSPGFTYPAIQVYAFAGVSSYQTESGATGAASPVASGSVTPSANGALVVSAYAGVAAVTKTLTPAGFTITPVPDPGAVSMNHAGAYYVQPTAAAINPTWAWTGPASAYNAVATAVFLAAAAAAAERADPYVWGPL